jgi:SAM-dependent methyltransferase
MLGLMQCPLCLQATAARCGSVHRDGKTEYTLYECPSCNGQFWDPLKNPGAEWYERDPRYAHRNGAPILEPNRNHTTIVSYLSPKAGRVLDVGCGVGNFLAHAQKHGWEPWGIDFDRDAINAAHETFGLMNTEVSDLASFAENHADLRGSFDLVTFFDVFEHIDDHIRFAGMVKDLLKPGGHAAMSMPYRFGARWLQPHDVPPRHLTRWEESSLRKFWERQGFNVKKISRHTEGPAPIMLKFRHRFAPYFSFNMVAKEDAKALASGVRQIGKRTFRQRVIRILAQAKDWMLYGIPAILTWIAMIPSKKRYVTLYAIVEKRQ